MLFANNLDFTNVPLRSMLIEHFKQKVYCEIIEIKELLKEQFEYQVMPAKSGSQNNIGISIVYKNSLSFDWKNLTNIKNVVFVVEDY